MHDLHIFDISKKFGTISLFPYNLRAYDLKFFKLFPIAKKKTLFYVKFKNMQIICIFYTLFGYLFVHFIYERMICSSVRFTSVMTSIPVIILMHYLIKSVHAKKAMRIYFIVSTWEHGFMFVMRTITFCLLAFQNQGTVI